MKTFVKLYRQTLDNELLARDNNAYIVFTKLLMRVNWKTGTMTTGRYKLGYLTNLKPTTAYAALKRLERNKMITTESTSHNTTVTVCNWYKYQSDDTSDDSLMTARRQPDDTINKNKRIKEEKNNNKVEMQSIYDHYVKSFGKDPVRYKFSDNRKRLVKIRLKDAGYKMIIEAITNISQQPFYTGDNDRGWSASLEFILRNYEQVERFANASQASKNLSVSEMQKDMEYVI